MQAKVFFGKLQVRIGEYENTVNYLILANSKDAAWPVLDSVARDYYGDEDTPEQDGGFYANDGEVFVQAQSLLEIGLGTFFDLKDVLPVRYAGNLAPPNEADLEGAFGAFSQALTAALNRRAKTVAHSNVLHALASACGTKNWHTLKRLLEVKAAAEAATSIVPAETTVDHYGLSAQLCYVEQLGYRIREHAQGFGWYALMPGETALSEDEERPNYLGFFSTQEALVEALLARHPRLTDEQALGLCKLHNLAILQHKEPIPGMRWFNLESTPGSFNTPGDAARAALCARGIRYPQPPKLVQDTVEARRRAVAELMFDACDFGAPVDAVNGWEVGLDSVSRVVFLAQDGAEDTKKVVFRVNFKFASAEPTGWAVE